MPKPSQVPDRKFAPDDGLPGQTFCALTAHLGERYRRIGRHFGWLIEPGDAGELTLGANDDADSLADNRGVVVACFKVDSIVPR